LSYADRPSCKREIPPIVLVVVLVLVVDLTTHEDDDVDRASAWRKR
jgi:hypothetical protein